MSLTVEQALGRCTDLLDEPVEAVISRLRDSDSDDLLKRHAPDLLEVEWQAFLGLAVRVGDGFRERADHLRRGLVAVSVEPVRRIVITPASQIRPRSVEWVWAARLPVGGVSLLAGMGGLGKSTLMLELAARLTRGELDGRHRGEPATVLYATTEDNWSQTIVPRLMAAGADLDRAMLVEVEDATADFVGGFSMPEDIEHIADAVRRSSCRLLVVDPLVAFLSDSVDAHRDHEIRRAMGPLHQMAEESDIAVLGVIHLNKRDSHSAALRINGSVGFYNVARSVLVLSQADHEQDVRLLTHPKSNLGRPAVTLRYRFEGAEVDSDEGLISTSRTICIGESPDVGPDAGLATLIDPSERSALDEACAFLTAELADGAVPSKVLFASAQGEGISISTLRRAKDRLRVKPLKDGENGGWSWHRHFEHDPNSGRDHLEHLGHLGRSSREDAQEGQDAVLAGGDRFAAELPTQSKTQVDASLAHHIEDRTEIQENSEIFRIAEILDGVQVLDAGKIERNVAVAAVRLWNYEVDNPPGSRESELCECGRTATHVREDGCVDCGHCLPLRPEHGVTEPFELVYP